MASVGLLFVGAVLFVNGAMLLGWVDGRSAAPINFFVGALQIITPTYLIFTANGDADTILAASGLYLFAFTYLYVGLNLTFDLDSTGLGFFCLFVAICAVIFSGINFVHFQDNGLGVIWLYWAFLWTLFYILLGQKRAGIERYTGAVCAIQGWVTAFIPAFLLLTGVYKQVVNPLAIALAIFGVVVFLALIPWARRSRTPAAPAPTVDQPAVV
ncbi:AmiS/UreI family transporter [Actinomycetospora endophytica]|uniref:AmiS/UreI family transporter n=1 Tax=Actinomycetospora endophytica TaxID=2291215 RepID=A0ABS8PD51_9PSEU|nr:AmiS/UreI family transporter [Actinomycetospora endophytica]MCD2196208.1 AmiS/UreI family transporter [Actinomycetospora endophytica]